MCAKRQQSFQTSNSSFWRQTGGAIPGRVNLTKSGGSSSRQPHSGSGTGFNSSSSSTSAAAHSFNNFQESVSDAWDIDEPLTPPVKKGERVLESVHGQRATPAPRPSAAPPPLLTEGKRVTSGAVSPPTLQNATGSVGNRSHQSNPDTSSSSYPPSSDQSRCAKFDKVLAQMPVNMTELESLSWSGVPQQYRTQVWKMLCGYLPASKSEQVIQRKREEYAGYLSQYFDNKEEIHKDTFR
jgi:hypothetical protein